MSSFDSGEDFLAHYGKKGMHWGIQKELGLMHGVISSNDIGEEFMAHYGVKGMHWGIRNDRQSDANGTQPDANGTQPQLTKEQKTKQNLLKAGKAFAGVVLLGYAGYQIHNAVRSVTGFRDDRAADKRLADLSSRYNERWGSLDISVDEDKRAAARMLYEKELKAIRDILDG